MIKAELKGQFLFLKFDCATRIRTNYLGLNVRYVSPTTKLPTTCTLAVVDTRSKHTAKELREIMDTVLSDYEIPLSHILCCVTDNASNMVKLVSSMSRDLESATQDQEEQDSSDEDEESHNIDEGTIDLSPAISASIEHMRCAAHTLQLAVYDGIKNSRAEAVIGRARNVVKEARTPKLGELIKKRTKKVAVLDMDTRWGSIYLMLDRLIELRTTIEEMADCGNQKLSMDPAHWQQTTELRDLLLKAYEATIRLQYSDCSPGYFYRKWSGLRLFYENQGSLLAEEIAKSMAKREPDLLNNGLLLAAVQLDVLNMQFLPEESEVKAREAVVNLVLRLKGIKDEREDSSSSEEYSPGRGLSDIGNMDSDEDFGNLRKMAKLSQRNTASVDSSSEEECEAAEAEVAPGDLHLTPPKRASSRPKTPASDRKSSASDMKAQITAQVSEGLDKLVKRSNVLRKSKKDLLTLIAEDYPAELQEVARLLYAKPVTQVSVERLFSALKIFKADSRNRLKEDILNALLILKANQ